MTRPDREDAVARALDILPPGDPAASDPRLLRDPALAEEARAAREAAADVWLAVSPLRAAPPDVLHSVMDKIGLPQAAPPERKLKLAPLLAASGWAAAAAIAICLWPRGTQLQNPGSVVIRESPPATKASNRDTASPLVPSAVAGPEAARQQREIERLRKRVAALREVEAASSPRIMSLTAPGKPRLSAEETHQRLSSALISAFKSILEAESGAPGDPAALVIQRGWLPEGLVVPDDGRAIRHLNFPEDSWQAHGLLRAPDGSYLDQARQIVWTREGTGGSVFVGRKTTGETDIAAYKPPDEADPVVALANRTEPEGFVVEDPVNGNAEVLIDQVPQPAEGTRHEIIWQDASGASGSIPVNSVAAANRAGGFSAPGGPHFYGNSAAQAGGAGNASLTPISAGGMMLFTIPNVNGLTSFQLVEVPLIPTSTSVPARIIVSGGR
jgi:hypothetical protein